MQGRRLLLAFAVWTALIWGGRVRNVLEDTELSTGGQAARLAVSIIFVGLAIAVGVLAIRNRPLSARGRALVQVAAVWTVGFWLVRAVQIALDDHSAAFIVVHVVLAVVSIALAVAAARAIRSGPLAFGHAGAQAVTAARR